MGIGDLGIRGLGRDWGLGTGTRTDWRQDPRGRRPDHVFARGAPAPSAGVACGAFAVAVVVDVEAAIQAEARVEDERADERAGAVARRLQHGGQRRQLSPSRNRLLLRTPWTGGDAAVMIDACEGRVSGALA